MNQLTIKYCLIFVKWTWHVLARMNQSYINIVFILLIYYNREIYMDQLTIKYCLIFVK